ncbi:hypothetical protein ABVT39_012435, partial [Epinephelus coioides]
GLQHISERYVPYVPVETREGTKMKPTVKFILAGDQLTKEKADTAVMSRKNVRKEEDNLDGLLPAIADFHYSMNFTDLIFKEFYNTTCSEPGTLYQLRNLLDHMNVTESALGDHYRLCSGFLSDVTDASITAAALHHFGMETVEKPMQNDPPPTTFSSTKEKQEWFDRHMFQIVDTYIMNDGGMVMSRVAEDTTNRQADTPRPKEDFFCDLCDLPAFRNQ